MKPSLYLFYLIVAAYLFITVIGYLLPVNNGYTDFLLTIAVFHFVASKVIVIRRFGEGEK